MWKIFIVTALVFIILSLFSALIFLMRDQGKGERTVRSLSWRVGLSLVLLLFIAFGYHLGFIGEEERPALPLSQNIDQDE